MSDYDSPWKTIIGKFFPQFMLFFFPKVHDAIDWNRGWEVLDKELQKIVKDSKQGRRYADKLVKVLRNDWLKD